jgi:hypothetical protein
MKLHLSVDAENAETGGVLGVVGDGECYRKDVECGGLDRDKSQTIVVSR